MTADQIKQWRKKVNVSQTQLATLLKVDVATVSRWERGIQTAPAFLALALQTINRDLKAGKHWFWKGRK
jgi:DNA-binding transcriptional regulator YiaG